MEDWAFISKSARMARNLLQKQMAHVMGVDVMTVSRWERGLTTPSPFQRARLEKMLTSSESEITLREVHQARTGMSAVEFGWGAEFRALSQGFRMLHRWQGVDIEAHLGRNYLKTLEVIGAWVPPQAPVMQEAKNGAHLIEIVGPEFEGSPRLRHILARITANRGAGQLIINTATPARLSDAPGVRVLSWY
jgi:transcriptional regulator with XRE-family HTH domain